MIRKHITVNGKTTGKFETRTLMGREHVVVPVVAMIEGVRFGANQSSAELCLAQEFGKFPEGWNNRPVVLGHPTVQSGDDIMFVSAGSADILDQYAIGITQATTASNGKLKMQAWLDKSVIDRSEKHQTMFNRVNAGEAIEVSVGFFTEVEEKRGSFKGQEYSGVWRSIVPDHLAFLDAGVPGACSLADGCGAPRVNTKESTMGKATKAIKDAALKLHAATKPAGKKADTTTASDETIEDDTGISGPSVNNSGCNCGCGGTCYTGVSDTFTTLEASSKTTPVAIRALKQLIVQSIPDLVLSGDVLTQLQAAITEVWPSWYSFVIGFTNNTVVFTCYDADGDGDWDTYQMPFDMDADGNVEFTAQPESVKLMTRIVPASASDSDADEGTELEQFTTLTLTEETDMTDDKNKGKVAANIDAGGGSGGNGYNGPNGGKKTGLPSEITGKSTVGAPEKTSAADTDASVDETTAEALKIRSRANAAERSAIEAAKRVLAKKGVAVDDEEMDGKGDGNNNSSKSTKAQTAQEYIDNAPYEIRSVLQSAIKAQAAYKDTVIQSLQATGRCHFDVQTLKAQSIDHLESLLVLAGASTPHVSNYSGMSAPVPYAQAAGHDAAPAAPTKVFERGDLTALQARVGNQSKRA